MRILLFDRCVIGFGKWAKRRLELLGYRVVFTGYRYDHHIVEEAKKMDAIVVTYDKDFPYTHKIVLNQENRYEEQYTELVKKLVQVVKECRGDVLNTQRQDLSSCIQVPSPNLMYTNPLHFTRKVVCHESNYFLS